MSDLVRWANEVAAAAGPEFRSRHAHVLVDEFQDTSALQLSLATAVAPDGCVTVVGDDDQSIYGFQGAEVRNFQRFARGDAELAAVAGGAKRGARVVRLQRNYRSSSMIVEASCAVVRANKLRLKKEVFTTRDAGARVRVVSCRTTDVELDVVCAELRRALAAYGAAGGRGGAALDGPRVAVLYRTHNVGKAVRAALKKAKIPAYVCGLRQRQAVVLEVCGLLRCVANGRDDAAVERCGSSVSRTGGSVAVSSATRRPRITSSIAFAVPRTAPSCLLASPSNALADRSNSMRASALVSAAATRSLESGMGGTQAPASRSIEPSSIAGAHNERSENGNSPMRPSRIRPGAVHLGATATASPAKGSSPSPGRDNAPPSTPIRASAPRGA